jgi:hypothetical protein
VEARQVEAISGKLSIREVYHDHKNYDNDHDLIPDIYSAHKGFP